MQIRRFNWHSTIIAVSCVILLEAMKRGNARFLPKYPLPVEVVSFQPAHKQLFLIVICILVTWGFNLHDRWHLKTMQDYPVVRGLAPFEVPPMQHLLQIIPHAIIIALIIYAISISMGKTFASNVPLIPCLLNRTDTEWMPIRN